MFGRIIAVANQKGGVGKTTTAVNLAASLADAGKRVLLIDFDPQANATNGIGLNGSNGTGGIYDAIGQTKAPSDVIQDTALEGLKLIPSTPALAGAELELVDVPHRESRLKDICLVLAEQHDFILIDCPPSFGLLTINALVAAESVLIPVQCEYYAIHGLGQLIENINRVRRIYNKNLSIEGILLTMLDARNNLCNQVAQEIRATFNDRVFASAIPRNVALAEAPSYGRPVLTYNNHSAGSRAYIELAQEVLRHGKESVG